MTEKKQTTPWKERHTAEKTTLIVGWCLIAVLMVYGFLPSKPEPTEPSQTLVSEAAPPTALHTIASTEALASATHYLSQLDSAMAEGIHLLKTNQLPELAAHSRAFKALLEAGHVQFGRSVFQPLGTCSSVARWSLVRRRHHRRRPGTGRHRTRHHPRPDHGSHRMPLINNWRRSHRLYSIQISLVIALVALAQLDLLPLWQPQLSPKAYAALNSALAILLFVARLIKQGPDQPALR
ncbi:hypothetical protein [Pseudomonas sp. ANT_H12B]|uniref:DUF7940 domain-containing protein n=1 Tax=Pseudomonas sp. ANT_H12B TaxID=2597348 RepID=UPI00211683E2|nr:hypothetical protein [Pseudomonas sp. ANT_H12B]